MKGASFFQCRTRQNRPNARKRLNPPWFSLISPEWTDSTLSEVVHTALAGKKASLPDVEPCILSVMATHFAHSMLAGWAANCLVEAHASSMHMRVVTCASDWREVEALSGLLFSVSPDDAEA